MPTPDKILMRKIKKREKKKLKLINQKASSETENTTGIILTSSHTHFAVQKTTLCRITPKYFSKTNHLLSFMLPLLSSYLQKLRQVSLRNVLLKTMNSKKRYQKVSIAVIREEYTLKFWVRV